MAVTVMNLSTGEKQVYTCDPKTAVISAYGQSLKDWCTWDYEKRYLHLVEEGKSTWLCGDFSAFKDGREF